MSTNSKNVVLIAICGNAVLTILKFTVAVPTHSAAMMNEAIHSLMDTLNQLFLLMGLKSGSRPTVGTLSVMARRNICGTCGARLVFSQSAVGWGFHMPGMPGRRAITSPNRLLLNRLYSDRSILWHWR